MKNEKVWEKQSKDWEKTLFYSKKTLFLKWLSKISKKTDKILDQGTGIGQYTFSAYKIGFKNIIGMDFSEELLKKARENADKLKYRVKFVKGDIRDMPFSDEAFDVVISAGIIEHVPETGKCVEELARVLKKRGYLLIHVPQKISVFTIIKKIQQFFGTWKCGYEKSFTKKYFSKLLEKNGFEIKEYFLNPFVAGKHKIIGGILEFLDKPLYSIGFGGHQIHFLAKKIKNNLEKN
jgi:ubiquinone/menaquinone biosynthesis C-methylase UbiE